MEAPKLQSIPDTELHTEEAALLPENILLGTSSWNYPGWQGIVYHESYKDEKDLRSRALEEYAQFPWFRTVGIDATFYAPLSEKAARTYASQVPDDFRWLSKVWEEITVPAYAAHPRYGDKAGKENPNFLNADLFIERVLGTYSAPELKAHAGPFVFEFQRMSPAEESRQKFLERLNAFLGKLPKDFLYAVEVRTAAHLTAEYFQILNAHGATHCFNHWTSMPPLRQQMERAAHAGGLTAPFFVARILTPLNVTFEQAVKAFSPYNRIVKENPEMRRDALTLIRRAIQRKIEAFVLFGNRAEGCSPLTVDAVGHAAVEMVGTAE